VPEPPVIEVEDSVQTRLLELVVTARVTVPVKLFRGATVIVEVAPEPALAVRLVGLADNEKSGAAVI
jgi:hypothetical protein